MGAPNDITQATLYDGSITTNDYALMPGVCVLPLAEDPPTTVAELLNYSPVVIARLHAPYRIRKYDCAASKQNNPPVMPTPQDAGAFVFLGGSISFASHLNSTFWNFDWSAQSSYLFVENCVSRPQDGFVLGSITPFTNSPDLASIEMFSLRGRPTVGAVSLAGPSAIAGFNYGQSLIGLTPESFDTGVPTGSHPLIRAWSYNMTAFYPGTLLNDNLANGGVAS